MFNWLLWLWDGTPSQTTDDRYLIVRNAKHQRQIRLQGSKRINVNL